jgi:serine/threonine protein phosphatase PrpC
MVPELSAVTRQGLAFGAATRSFRQLAENGDAFLFRQWERNALAGLIDGLGHGPGAQNASQTARHYLEEHFAEPLEDLFSGTGEACRATRGVVMALARFDLTRQTLSLASVGDIEIRLQDSPRQVGAMQRGVVGFNAPDAVVVSHPWTPQSLLVMHSDGLRADWDWHHFRHELPLQPSVIAQRLLAELAKMDDDATVIVVKGAE